MKFCVGFECNGCRLCWEICPASAIKAGERAFIVNEKCNGCGECVKVCPVGAIHVDDESN